MLILLKPFVRAGLLLLGLCTGGIALALLLGPVLPRGTGELAFAAAMDGDLDIYRMDVDRGLVRPITFNDVPDGQPVWSPDGQHIAFISFRDRSSEIYVMNAYGKDQRHLIRDVILPNIPAWSPDGKYLVYVKEFGLRNSELMRLELSTGTINRLSHNDSYDTHPAWSPDGRRIIFVSDRDITADFNIYVMNVDGSDAKVLVATHYGSLPLPAWSPDGRYVIYTADSSNKVIFLTDLATGQVTSLLTNNFTGDRPDWSPDGRFITYSAEDSNNLGFSVIYIMNAACISQPETCPDTMRRLDVGTAISLVLSPRWRPG